MNELKFNSQACTDINQSKKLLELGLKPETADMYIFDNEVYIGKPNVDDIPAWSLHRLLLFCDVTAMFTRDTLETAYDDLINVIENLIKNGYFNKEYLKR